MIRKVEIQTLQSTYNLFTSKPFALMDGTEQVTTMAEFCVKEDVAFWDGSKKRQENLKKFLFSILCIYIWV